MLTPEKLDQLSKIPFEQWGKLGVRFKSVSATCNGIVNSAILSDGSYIRRLWWDGFKHSSLFNENETVKNRKSKFPELVP